jgi:sugar phosphate isomerase/epimerase
MKLGFVSAILPDLSLEEVVQFAAAEGYECLELMCWPTGRADRRYAGVTHVDVTNMTDADAKRVRQLMDSAGVYISGLGYYPNPLQADRDAAEVCIDHIRKVIVAAARLGVNEINTFIGRDPSKSVEGNWPRFKEVWVPLIEFADEHGVNVGIENCPMYFTADEWPSGKNLAHSPAIWRRMFAEIPSPRFGLNYDAAHLVWQHMEHVKPVYEFAKRIFHCHAKDVCVDRARLDDVGILAMPLEYHYPKLPGLGQVEWGRLISALTDIGYEGSLCVEVEDRSYEVSLEKRKQALRQSHTFLRQFIPAKKNL